MTNVDFLLNSLHFTSYLLCIFLLLNFVERCRKIFHKFIFLSTYSEFMFLIHEKNKIFFHFLGAKVQALGYGKVPRITGKIIASSKYEICQVDLVK